jgi:hypothetical protein
MKVKELIEELTKVNPEAVVVLSIDSEGNAYNEVHSMSNEYNWKPLWGEIGLKKLTEELEADGWTEEDTMPDGVDCVLLWP